MGGERSGKLLKIEVRGRGETEGKKPNKRRKPKLFFSFHFPEQEVPHVPPPPPPQPSVVSWLQTPEVAAAAAA